MVSVRVSARVRVVLNGCGSLIEIEIEGRIRGFKILVSLIWTGGVCNLLFFLVPCRQRRFGTKQAVVEHPAFACERGASCLVPHSHR